jgi:lysozyme
MASVERPRQPKAPPALPAIVAAAVLICAPLTASREGLRTKPYLDPAGIPTVCYGETELPLRVYSADECGAMLRQRLLKDYAPKIAACLPELVDKQKANALAAFIDAAYNAGPSAVCKSRMAKAVHAGQLGVACDAFSGWYVIARGKKLPGLVKRREAERKLCMVDA